MTVRITKTIRLQPPRPEPARTQLYDSVRLSCACWISSKALYISEDVHLMAF